ncbi:hypothetical protein PVAP13_9NG040255 [Panicum virgatum]|uniref:Uncharacterized protein n=1 Tax=Panicum virgatum TaxID=38727 RepID=A0A8T0MAZ4_PANVG|nr:hypothetical protein PVAP13_9NG040255 [Panicum virgatum]
MEWGPARSCPQPRHSGAAARPPAWHAPRRGRSSRARTSRSRRRSCSTCRRRRSCSTCRRRVPCSVRLPPPGAALGALAAPLPPCLTHQSARSRARAPRSGSRPRPRSCLPVAVAQ